MLSLFHSNTLTLSYPPITGSLCRDSFNRSHTHSKHTHTHISAPACQLPWLLNMFFSIRSDQWDCWWRRMLERCQPHSGDSFTHRDTKRQKRRGGTWWSRTGQHHKWASPINHAKGWSHSLWHDSQFKLNQRFTLVFAVGINNTIEYTIECWIIGLWFFYWIQKAPTNAKWIVSQSD